MSCLVVLAGLLAFVSWVYWLMEPTEQDRIAAQRQLELARTRRATRQAETQMTAITSAAMLQMAEVTHTQRQAETRATRGAAPRRRADR